ncbi:MAG: four helix bundle protein [Pseudomonadota bacterium]
METDTGPNLVILARTFDLLDWLLPKAERFPRIYRHTLTARIMNNALDFHEQLVRAATLEKRSRRTSLLAADRALAGLRIYLRLIHRWRWLSDGQYAHVTAMTGELGRLLGGWLRSERNAR